MPPRYAYWTIIVDNQPTAFRAGSTEDLMPTFKRLKEKHPTATMMWFQNGKLWNSRVDAQEAMRARGEKGRRGDTRQGGFRERKTFAKPPQSRTTDTRPARGERLEWKPKGAEQPKRDRPRHDERSHDRPKFDRPKFDRPKPEWRPKPAGGDGPRPSKLEWKPKGAAPSTEHRSEPRSPRKPQPRDKNWRPGGEHRDPRQKYKDAKKAKWQRFKKQVRSRWEAKQDKEKKAGGSRPPHRDKKRRDDES